jgi:16S rRNA (guanine527-N7)-methyltransferase
MSSLPEVTRSELEAALQPLAGVVSVDDLLEPFLGHYRALRRWNTSAGLVGAGAGEDPAVRHYLESLCALRLVAPDELAGAGLLDVGSGAGFPGLILAMAVPELTASLVERREKKAAFLRTVTGRWCPNALVIEESLDQVLSRCQLPRIDFVTLRAVQLEGSSWRRLLDQVSAAARVLLWAGPRTPIPAGLTVRAAIRLPGSRARQILLLERAS